MTKTLLWYVIFFLKTIDYVIVTQVSFVARFMLRLDYAVPDRKSIFLLAENF